MYHPRLPFTLMHPFPNLTWTLSHLISLDSHLIRVASRSFAVFSGCSSGAKRARLRLSSLIDHLSYHHHFFITSTTHCTHCRFLTFKPTRRHIVVQTGCTRSKVVEHPRRVNIDEGAIGRYGWRSTRGIRQHDLPESTYHSRPPDPTTSCPQQWIQWVSQRTYLTSQERQGRDERDHQWDPLER